MECDVIGSIMDFDSIRSSSNLDIPARKVGRVWLIAVLLKSTVPKGTPGSNPGLSSRKAGRVVYGDSLLNC